MIFGVNVFDVGFNANWFWSRCEFVMESVRFGTRSQCELLLESVRMDVNSQWMDFKVVEKPMETRSGLWNTSQRGSCALQCCRECIRAISG